MGDEDQLKSLMEEAISRENLRLRFSQDRSVSEFVDSARREGYSLTERDVKKILVGAYLTDENLGAEQKNRLIGGLSPNYLDKVEGAIDGDYSFLADARAWERSRDFHDYVFKD